MKVFVGYCFLIGLFIFYSISGFSQSCDTTLNPGEKYNLLYAVDITKNTDDSNFLIPTIENILRRFKFPDKNRSPRFNHITNINRLREDKEINLYITEVFEDYLSNNNVDFDLSKDRKSSKEEVIKKILGHKDFLYIKIRNLEDRFIEYQFYRYLVNSQSALKAVEILAQKDKLHYGDLPVHEFISSSSTFLKLDEEFSLQINKLEKALKQVFCETNKKPLGKINTIYKIEKDTVHFSKGDTIKLSAQVIDYDSRREFFSYSWRQIKMNDSQVAIELRDDQIHQEFVINHTDTFQIGLIVNDGIMDSEEKKITIIVIEKPKLIPKKYRWQTRKRNQLKDQVITSTNPYSWATKIYIKKTAIGFKYLDEEEQIAQGLVFSSNFSETDLIVEHSNFQSAELIDDTPILSLEIPALNKDSIIRFEYETDNVYSLGTFQSFFNANDSVKSDSFNFAVQTRSSHNYLPPAGTYRFNLFAQQNGISSEPIVLTTLIRRYSMISPEYSFGAISELKDSSEFRVINSFGLKLELSKNIYVRTGTQLKNLGDNSNLHKNFYFGVEYGTKIVGFSLNMLVPYLEEVGMAGFDVALTLSIKDSFPVQYMTRVGYRNEPEIFNHGFYFEMSLFGLLYRSKLKKKYRN